MNIYIGNFSYDITRDDLKKVFAPFGHVATVKIINDKMNGRSRGFGFVEMPNREEAQSAMQGIVEIKGKKITINEARAHSKSGPFGGGGGGPRQYS